MRRPFHVPELGMNGLGVGRAPTPPVCRQKVGPQTPPEDLYQSPGGLVEPSYPFTLWCFRNGRVYEFTSRMPVPVGRALNNGRFDYWYAFLSGLQERLDRADRERA